MNEWFQAHWPEGGILGIGFLLMKWLLGREVNRREERDKDFEGRIRQLEASRVTRADMDELRMSLMASMNLVHADLTRSMNQVQADVRTITQHLLEK